MLIMDVLTLREAVIISLFKEASVKSAILNFTIFFFSPSTFH